MKTPRPTRLLLGIAALAAAATLWWLLARSGPVTVPVVAGPEPVAGPPAELAAPSVAPETVAPLPEAAPKPAEVAYRPAVVSVPTPVPDQVRGQTVAPTTNASVPNPAVDEVAATERMYVAHSSLRAPEVADPDSDSNRRILQTMVEKALSAPTIAPTANATN